MKNTIKVLGIIAIVAVIGFMVVACDGSPDPTPDPDTYTDEQKEVTTAGRLTITGLSAYNGKKILASGYTTERNEGEIYIGLEARQTAKNGYYYINGNLNNVSTGEQVYGTITNGGVTLSVFRQTINTYSSSQFESYAGSEQNVEFSVAILEGATSNDPSTDIAGGKVTVNFTNGVGSGTFVLSN